MSKQCCRIIGVATVPKANTVKIIASNQAAVLVFKKIKLLPPQKNRQPNRQQHQQRRLSASTTVRWTAGDLVPLHPKVKAAATGQTIESLQDTSSYASKQSSAGGSISVGATGITGGSASASQSKIDSNFASVGQQSGIKAGDGGFDVKTAGNTDLKGAVIASTQSAVDNNKNSFTTGSLSTSDLQNSASFKGSAAGVSMDVGQQAGKFGVSGVGQEGAVTKAVQIARPQQASRA